jgi:DNA-directed RNA polymerase specialized sigma24 family protein
MVESESALLRRFADGGDAGAFAEIVRRYAGLVYGTCLRVLADADKAADATQETFFQLMKKADAITGSLGAGCIGSPSARRWILSVMTRRAGSGRESTWA